MIAGVASARNWVPPMTFRDRASDPEMLQVSLDSGADWNDAVSRLHPDHRMVRNWKQTRDSAVHSDTAWHVTSTSGTFPVVRGRKYLVTCLATISQSPNPGLGNVEARLRFTDGTAAHQLAMGTQRGHGLKDWDAVFMTVIEARLNWGESLTTEIEFRGESSTSHRVFVRNEYWTALQLN